MREREGRPFRFTALARSDRQFDRLAVYVQAQLRQVGAQMDVQVLEPGLVRDRLRAGNFEAVFDFFSSGNVGYLRRFLGRNNPMGYQNPAIVQLTNQLVTADPDELDRIYRALTEVFRADLPVTCLCRLTSTAFAHRRVQGLSTPFHASPDTYMEELWLEKAR